MCGLHENTMTFYTKILSIRWFWYPQMILEPIACRYQRTSTLLLFLKIVVEAGLSYEFKKKKKSAHLHFPSVCFLISLKVPKKTLERGLQFNYLTDLHLQNIRYIKITAQIDHINVCYIKNRSQCRKSTEF